MVAFGARIIAAADVALRSSTGLVLAIGEGVLAPLHPRVNGFVPSTELAFYLLFAAVA